MYTILSTINIQLSNGPCSVCVEGQMFNPLALSAVWYQRCPRVHINIMNGPREATRKTTLRLLLLPPSRLYTEWTEEKNYYYRVLQTAQRAYNILYVHTRITHVYNV